MARFLSYLNLWINLVTIFYKQIMWTPNIFYNMRTSDGLNYNFNKIINPQGNLYFK